MAKEQLQELMRRNDMICQEMGLPAFDAPTQQGIHERVSVSTLFKHVPPKVVEDATEQ